MRRIKLAYFIDSYKPGAGTENQLKGLLQNLDPNQVEATFFTIRDEVLPEHRAEIPWPVETLNVGRLASAGSLLKFFKLIRRLRHERYDIVSIYFNDSNLFVVPACRLAGIKHVIVNRRNTGYIRIPEILKKLNRANRSDQWFSANSEAVKRRVVELEGFPPEKIKVIYNGVWDRQLKSEKIISRQDLGLAGHCHVVGITANLRPVKRIDRFLEVASKVLPKIGNARFLILGEGELREQLEKQAGSLGINDQVKFLGHVSDVSSYLPLFDIGVLTSESEGLSNTLIEYLYFGVPAVAFDIGGNGEVIEDGIGGYLVTEGDTSSMADKIVRLLTDDQHRRHLGEAGKRYVEDKFAPDKVMQETMAFYRQILQS